ncbi:MAG: class I tRNA ligase family protein, partial [Ktedonobacteraceae bacterium]|nr:class I tRNA ligase family protein [Ktedonobacteraceae bacterium]
FWSDLCDNYLELIKSRLYNASGAPREAACWTLYQALLTTLKLLAPFLPFITEEIYQGLFRQWEGSISIHRVHWPTDRPEWLDTGAEQTGAALLDLLGQVRRYKADHGLSIGAELDALRINALSGLRLELEAALIDLRSATRAREITIIEDDGQDAPLLDVIMV